jgi:hypothetical protein
MKLLLQIASYIMAFGAGMIFALIFLGNHRFEVKELNQDESNNLSEILFKENDS